MSQAKKKKTKKNEQNKNTFELVIFALLLILIILSLVMIIRLTQSKPLFPIGESYYNLRIAQSLKQDFFLTQDPVQGIVYEPNPYHYLLALLLVIFPSQLVSLFFPLLLGVLSGFLFFKLLVLLGVKPKQAAYSLIVLSVTPVFIILFTGLYLSGFVIFISLLAMVLILHKKYNILTLCFSLLLLLLLALTNLVGFLVTLIILFFLCLALKKAFKKNFKKNLRALLLSVLISVLVIVPLTLFSNYAPRLLGFHTFAFKNIFSILRASLGFDLFLFVLFLTGFVIIWIKDKEKKLFHLVVLVFIILSLFNSTARVFASFIITIYCVVAITYFYNRKWELSIIKTGTILLVLCSLVFSVMNQASLLVDAQPDKEMQNALVFLKNQDKGRVLTSEENGFLIEFYSEKNVLLDANSFLISDYSELRSDANTLFRAARLKEAEPMLKEHELRYILITPSMKQELWEAREQELWFLIKHSESFIKKYEEGSIEIWGYVSV
nr:hypothetical protein [Nanoarchaeota archaeon]